ncbi:MAG: GNAT family N-acetyltransferase [Culturomica sp.]|jgi:predicted acetyltransferase|nr:GNAT family N-acetyltransferase [Culturomica sp.]
MYSEENKRLDADYRRLWKICFPDDTDEFIRFYFERKFMPENSVSLYKGNNLIAAMMMLPYPFSFYTYKQSTAYISGACTIPDERGKGYMTTMMQNAIKYASEKDFTFTALIPQEDWLYSYYSKFGYSEIFQSAFEEYSIKYPINNSNITQVEGKEASVCFDELYYYFNSHANSRDFTFLHDRYDFSTILEDLFIAEGKFFVSRNSDNQIDGMMFTVAGDDKDSVRVYELFADSSDIKNHLLQTAGNHWKRKSLICKSPNVGNYFKKSGMLRIINALKALQIYAKNNPEQTFEIYLTDDLLEINNGYFSVKDGNCKQSTMPTSSNCREIGIQQLPTLIFPQHPYISLMLD